MIPNYWGLHGTVPLEAPKKTQKLHFHLIGDLWDRFASLASCIKNCSKVIQWSTYYLMIQLLDKRYRGNKLARLQHACLDLLSTCAKGVQFYCPSRTYPLIPYCCSIFSFKSTGKWQMVVVDKLSLKVPDRYLKWE